MQIWARRALAGGRTQPVAAVPDLATPGAGNGYSLRWNLLKVIGEYARHNGHADLLRETLDGSAGKSRPQTGLECPVRAGGQDDVDHVPRPDLAPGDDDAHDPGPPYERRRRRRARARPSSARPGCRRAGGTDCADRSARRPWRARGAGAVPVGSASRSMPRVVTFSPMAPAATAKPRPRSSSCSSAAMRWTWRRFGWVGSRATRDRCCTVVPACASPSTPRPSTSRIVAQVPLASVCAELRCTVDDAGSLARPASLLRNVPGCSPARSRRPHDRGRVGPDVV